VRKLSRFLGEQEFDKASMHELASTESQDTHELTLHTPQVVQLHVNFRYSEQIRLVANAVFEKLIWYVHLIDRR